MRLEQDFQRMKKAQFLNAITNNIIDLQQYNRSNRFMCGIVLWTKVLTFSQNVRFYNCLLLIRHFQIVHHSMNRWPSVSMENELSVHAAEIRLACGFSIIFHLLLVTCQLEADPNECSHAITYF